MESPTAVLPTTGVKGPILGLFIVFEGGEGSGKSTQAKALSRRVQRAGYPVIFTREPGGTSIGDVLRRLIKNSPGLDPLTELFLIESARAQLVHQVIAPALQRGETVICDRFIPSTVAYQGGGRGVDIELIHRVNREATAGLRPDMVIFLDLPVEVGLRRLKGPRPDNFERQDVEFHRRVRESYLTQAREDPERWLVLDGTKSKATLSRAIWERVLPALESKAG